MAYFMKKMAQLITFAMPSLSESSGHFVLNFNLVVSEATDKRISGLLNYAGNGDELIRSAFVWKISRKCDARSDGADQELDYKARNVENLWQDISKLSRLTILTREEH